MTPSGTVTEYMIPTLSSRPEGITAGPDGNLWFTESNTNKIGKITTSGTFTEYTIPTSTSSPWGITSGPDGNLWFTENSANEIGKVTTSGSFTEYTIPTSSSNPRGVTSGPDGSLWFAEGAKIGKVTTSGSFTEYSTGGGTNYGITTGADGNLWFTQNTAWSIGKITTAGTITTYTIPTPLSSPEDITSGPDGSLWFTEFATGKLGRVTTSGTFMEYGITATNGNAVAPTGIASGPDGNVWFTIGGDSYVEKLATGISSTLTQTVDAADGSGTLTSNVASVTNSSTGNTITFTYTAATGGISNGTVQLVVPSGWSAPSTTGIDNGYATTAASGATLGVAGQTITVSAITLGGGNTFTITYGDLTGGGIGATATTSTRSQTWQGSEQSTAGGAMTNLAGSPSINVT